MITKKNTKKLYNLPEKVKFCKKCTISNQRPRIGFDEEGVCSACRFNEFKRVGINWEDRNKELKDLCDLHRTKDGSYDVIVPCSGGKDGSYVAHQLKNKYGMTPLCVTWSPLRYTQLGRENLQKFIDSGFSHILGTPNPEVSQRLTKFCLEEMGDPFQPFIYGQYNFPLKVALQNKIKLVMYGENGEVEYGGDMKNAYRPTRDLSDVDKHYFSGYSPEYWYDKNFTKSDIYPYLAPSFKELSKAGVEVHFWSYYNFWDPQENFYYCVENTGFSPAEERNAGTYSRYASLDDELDGFHYYLMLAKFGIGRATSDSAHEIRDGKITREEGITLVKKYDNEFPEKYIKGMLDYCDISLEKLIDIIDSWRSDHIWGINNNGEYFLKHPIWENTECE